MKEILHLTSLTLLDAKIFYNPSFGFCCRKLSLKLAGILCSDANTDKSKYDLLKLSPYEGHLNDKGLWVSWIIIDLKVLQFIDTVPVSTY